MTSNSNILVTIDLLQVDLSHVLISERGKLQCMRSCSKLASNKVDLFGMNGFEWYYKPMREKKLIGKLCRERREISLLVLLVNCNDVSGRIFDWRISRQTGMRSPLKWHNQPGKKNKGLSESLPCDITP